MGNNDTQCYPKSQKPIQHKNPRTHIPCAFTPQMSYKAGTDCFSQAWDIFCTSGKHLAIL